MSANGAKNQLSPLATKRIPKETTMNTEINPIDEIVVPSELSDVDALIYLVRISDKADALTREGLYKVFTEGTWEGRFSSWGEFVESAGGLNKSQGWASKHLAIHKHYILEGGLSPEKLEGAATESLYMARTLPGTPEEQVSISRTLTRREIKETRQESDGHVHIPKTLTICEECGIRLPDPLHGKKD